MSTTFLAALQKKSATLAPSVKPPQSTPIQVTAPIHSEDKVTPVKSITVDPESLGDESEAYRNFKSQVNALQTELKVDAADLMLMAIACLYTKTFNVN